MKALLKNWLVVALRNLIKHPLYSTINIVGLAVGLASCIAIILFVRDEVSFDRWIPDASRIYRVHTRYDFPGRAPLLTNSSAGPVMPSLLQDYPQLIESAVRVMPRQVIVRHGSDLYFEDGAFADASFFKVFDLPLATGDRAVAMPDPSSIVLNQRLARKYFGDRDAIGQTLTLSYASVTRDFHVSAVVRDLPPNSTLKFDLLIPLVEQDFMSGKVSQFESWGNQFMQTFVKLKDGATIAPLSDDLNAFLKRHVDEQRWRNMSLSVMALPDLHLRASASYSASAPVRERAVTAFAVVAVLILAIASINFMNLATARATQRVREVAMRKVLGAHRSHLVIQFIGESVLVALLALALALVLVETALPTLNAVLQKHMAVSFFGRDSLLPALLGLVVFVGVMGGTYPALYLSRFEPARILRPAATSKLGGNVSARQVLVVVQFVISIALIICTAIVHQQTEHMRTMDTGYDREGLLVVRGLARPDAKAVAETIRQQVARLPGAKAVALSDTVPGDDSNSETSVRKPGSPDKLTINIHNVGFDFFATYGTPVIVGREFSPDHGGDDFAGEGGQISNRGGNVLLSVNALSRFGFNSPQAAIGQTLDYEIGDNGESVPATIVGIVPDIHFRSARDEQPPIMFLRNSNNFQNLTVRYSGIGEAEFREEVAGIWRRLVPSVPFRADFLTAVIDNQYQAEKAQGTMFTAFAILAVVVACLGLFGLAAFTAERRTKEIGLRKVLGAKVPDIVQLLLWQFSKPVALANLLAWPIAYLVMRNWLNGFEFRIALSPLFFIAAGFAALMIAWVTIVGHAVRVARAKPIIALRYE